MRALDRIATAFALAAAGGCDSSPSIFLATPDHPGARSLVARDEAGEPAVAQAIEQPLMLRVADPTVIELSLYRESLEQLGLASGAVSPAACRPCALFEPLASYSVSINSGDVTWRAHEGVDSKLVDAIMTDRARCESCARFDTRTLRGPGPRSGLVSFAVPNDGTRALVISTAGDGAFWARPGAIERACLGVATSTPVAAYSAGPHAVWVSDASGTVSKWDTDRLRADEPCDVATTTRTASAGAPLVRISGSPEGTPEEMFAMTPGYQLLHYKAGAWAPVGRPLPGDFDYAAAWLGPERGLGAVAEEEVVWYREGRVEHEIVMVDGRAINVTGGWIIPPYGLVLGTRLEFVLFEDGEGGFRHAATALPSSEEIMTVVRWRASLILSENRGRIRQLHPKLGYCNSHTVFGDHTVQDVVVLDDGAIIGAPNEVLVVTAVEETTCPGG